MNLRSHRNKLERASSSKELVSLSTVSIASYISPPKERKRTLHSLRDLPTDTGKTGYGKLGENATSSTSIKQVSSTSSCKQPRSSSSTTITSPGPLARSSSSRFQSTTSLKLKQSLSSASETPTKRRKTLKTAWIEEDDQPDQSTSTHSTSSLKTISGKSINRLKTFTTSCRKKKTTKRKESNILTKEQKQKVEKILKEFNKKQKSIRRNGTTQPNPRSQNQILNAANTSSIFDERYYGPGTVRLRTRSRRNVRMILKTLEDYGDGSTLIDLIDYSKTVCQTEHCNLLVLHTLKEAMKTHQVRTYNDLFVRQDCYDEFLEEEQQREKDKKMGQLAINTNSKTKIALKNPPLKAPKGKRRSHL